MLNSIKKKKIAIDCHTLEINNWAGKEYFLNNFISELTRFGENFEFLLYFKRPVYKNFFPANWRVININLPTPLWHFFVLVDLFRRKADILFCPCAYFLSALNFFIPQTIAIHDLTTFLPAVRKTHKIRIRIIEKFFLGRSLKRSKKIIAVSENTKNDLIKLFGISPDKITVIHEAHRPSFRPIEKKEETRKALEKYNLPQNFILFVGTIEPRKNIVRLIEAYKEAVADERFKDYKLVVAGKKGWYCEEIFKKVEELGLKNDVIFTGYLADADVPYFYNAAECFIYPSLYEGFGLPILEAMACGCPVITSNTSSLPEVAGDAAILIDPYNSKEISGALRQVLSDGLLRNKMREDGLKQSKKFSWTKAVRELLAVFNKL